MDVILWLWVGVISIPLLYWEWYRWRTRTCDACRLDKLGSSHQSIPHTCPFSRYRHAIFRSGGSIYEFGEESLSKHYKPSTKAVKGEVRDERSKREFSDGIQRERARRADERRVQAGSEAEIRRQVEEETEGRRFRAEAARKVLRKTQWQGREEEGKGKGGSATDNEEVQKVFEQNPDKEGKLHLYISKG